MKLNYHLTLKPYFLFSKLWIPIIVPEKSSLLKSHKPPRLRKFLSKRKIHPHTKRGPHGRLVHKFLSSTTKKGNNDCPRGSHSLVTARQSCDRLLPPHKFDPVFILNQNNSAAENCKTTNNYHHRIDFSFLSRTHKSIPSDYGEPFWSIIIIIGGICVVR